MVYTVIKYCLMHFIWVFSLPKYMFTGIHNENESNFMEDSIDLQISGRGRIITRIGSVVDSLVIVCSVFCYALLYVHSSFAII